MAGSRQAVRVVDANALGPSADPPVCLDHDMDPLIDQLAQSFQFGSGLVAGGGTIAAAEDRRPHERAPIERPAEGCVHTPVRPLPASGSHPGLRKPRCHAGLAQLTCGYHAVLLVEHGREVGDRGGIEPWHGHQRCWS